MTDCSQTDRRLQAAVAKYVAALMSGNDRLPAALVKATEPSVADDKRSK